MFVLLVLLLELFSYNGSIERENWCVCGCGYWSSDACRLACVASLLCVAKFYEISRGENRRWMIGDRNFCVEQLLDLLKQGKKERVQDCSCRQAQ